MDKMIRILPVGKKDGRGRRVNVTYADVQEMARNFWVVPGYNIPVNKEHDHSGGKLADVTGVEARQDGLYAELGNFKPGGRELYESGAFQYVSPEIAWKTEFDGKPYRNVLLALALTNNPFFGGKVALYSLRAEDIPEPHRTFVEKYNDLIASYAEAHKVGYREAVEAVKELDRPLYYAYTVQARMKNQRAASARRTVDAYHNGEYSAPAKTAGETLAGMVSDYAKKHKVRYSAALKSVAADHPELYRQYQDERR